MELYIHKQRLETPNVWFTSDSHHGHDNILRHCNRPFKTSREMDDTIISNCNECAGKDDVLFYLGDFCFHNRHRDECSHEELACRYRERINCKNIFFTLGNHDKKLRHSNRFQNLWRGTYDLLPIEVEGQYIVLCHYALRSWERSHHGAWNLYGHSHGDLPDDPMLLSFDVGVDPCNFWPLHFNDVRERMDNKIANGAGPTKHH